MRYQLKRNKPRPLSQCGAMVAPGQDARWRGIPRGVKSINRVHALDVQRKRGV